MNWYCEARLEKIEPGLTLVHIIASGFSVNPGSFRYINILAAYSIRSQMSIPATYFPDPELADCILCYGIAEAAECILEPFLYPPLGLSGFIIQHQSATGAEMAMVEGSDMLVNKAVATGQVTSTVTGHYNGTIKTLLIFFHPLGMYQLFGCDMHKLTNTSINLLVLLGEEKGQCLLNRLEETDDNLSLVYILNDFFKAQKPVLNDTTEIKRVLDFIHLHHGNVSIKDIEEHCYVHRKTIERHFLFQIGLSPKIYTSIYRFKCLMNYLQQNPEITWLQLSSLTGYYDQSHMVRYFKEYLKVSPNQLVTLNIDLINYLFSRS
jgi:AraC-like DNA-binding protein